MSALGKRLSGLRPRAKKWEPSAVLTALESTYNRNPMETNPLLPLNTKLNMQRTLAQTPTASHVIHQSEESGRKYAEILMKQVDRWSEEAVGGGKSPLPGFLPFPKSASEPHHSFIGHSGKRVRGFFLDDEKEGMLKAGHDADKEWPGTSHPVHIDRLKASRETLLEERVMHRSEESLRIKMDQHDVVAVLKMLIPNSKDPIVRVVEPLVRTNLVMNDFTSQAAFKDLSRTEVVLDMSKKHRPPLTEFPIPLVIECLERTLSTLTIGIWEQAQRREDCNLDVNDSYLLGNNLAEMFLGGKEPATSQINKKILPYHRMENITPLINRTLTQTLGRVQKMKEKEDVKAEYKKRLLTNKMLLDLLIIEHSKKSVIDSTKGRVFMSEFEKHPLGIRAYEVLLEMDPSSTTGVGINEHIEFVLSRLFMAGLKPSLRLYNTLLEKVNKPHQQLAIFADMLKDGIEPSLYSYAHIYEALFKCMMCRSTEANEDVPEHIDYLYNGSPEDESTNTFSVLLESFWKDLMSKRFLVSSDKRDLYALWRMMTFIEETFIKQIRGTGGDGAGRPGWKIYGMPNKEDYHNGVITKADWDEQRVPVYNFYPAAMTEADRILNLFKSHQHSQLVTPGLQADFFSRYIAVCRDHIHYVNSKMLHEIDRKYLTDETVLNDQESMKEIQNIQSTCTHNILETFGKGMRWLSCAHPDKSRNPLLMETFQFCNTMDRYTRCLLTPALVHFMQASGVDLAWNAYNMETDIVQRSQSSILDILRANSHVGQVQISRARMADVQLIQQFILKAREYLNQYDNLTDNQFETAYETITSAKVDSQSKADAMYSAFYQAHPDDILDIGEALVMMTNAVRVISVVTGKHENTWMVANRLGRAKQNGRDSLIDIFIRLLVQCGQYERGLALLEKFSEPPLGEIYDVMPFLQPENTDLNFIISALKKYETDSSLLERTVDAFIDINSRQRISSKHLFITQSDMEQLTAKFDCKKTLLAKIKSITDERSPSDTMKQRRRAWNR